MYPDLFHIGPVTIGSWAFMAAIAFLVGTVVSYRRGLQEGFDSGRLFGLAPLVLISAFLGARILYVAVNIETYVDRPAEIVQMWRGGLVGYGILLSLITGILYVKYRMKMPVWPIADVIAPALPLGIAIFRGGCFLNGCCYGSPSNLPWAVLFPTAPGSVPSLFSHRSGMAVGEILEPVPRHPTQLYEALFGLIMFAIMIRISSRIERRDGVIFFVFAAIYACWRILNESLRDDARGQLLLLFGHGIQDRLLWIEERVAEYLAAHPATFSIWISTSQLVSLAVLAGSLLFIRDRLKPSPTDVKIEH
ncbi:MAG: prolipoprotein diacylglyceryl transferase [Acidobacteria bacterium]|nr:prolipoprotein diacylglyceryl transferase [Acidobacteriota bacterium]